MNKEKVFELLRITCYSIFLCLFFAWLINAVENYISMPTTTKVALKYGDDNKKNISFPTLTFCKKPVTYTKLWNDAPFCGNKTVLSSPYFLSYMEACLESNSNETVSELLARVTYNASEVFSGIKTDPPGSSPLQLPEDWKKIPISL